MSEIKKLRYEHIIIIIIVVMLLFLIHVQLNMETIILQHQWSPSASMQFNSQPNNIAAPHSQCTVLLHVISYDLAGSSDFTLWSCRNLKFMTIFIINLPVNIKGFVYYDYGVD